MKYIIVNSVKDAKRYLRKANKKNNTTMHNITCVHLADIAKEIVIKSRAKKGILKALDVLDGTSSADLLLEILVQNVKENYFVPEESLSKETAREISRILHQLRMGEVTSAYEEKDSVHMQQKKALIKEYEQTLMERDQYDVPLLYQHAIHLLKAEGVPEKCKTDSFVITDVCKEKLSAIENQFLDMYTQGKYSLFSLDQTYPLEVSEWLSGAKFFKAYGMANEVNYCLEQILEKNQNLSEVEIFYTASDYEPYIEACFGARKIPYAMMNRQLPADNLYLHVMKYILEWAADNYVYEGLKPAMVLSKEYRSTYYSQIRAGIGWEKSRYEDYCQKEADSDFAKCLMYLIQILEDENGEVRSYTAICSRLLAGARKILGDGKEYKYASGAMSTVYERIKHLQRPKSKEEAIAELLDELRALTFADAEDDEAVCIRKLDADVHVLERKHIYVLGMSNTHYSTASTESPVLSDEELETYLNIEKGYVRLQKNAETEKRNAFYQTLSTRDGEGTLCMGYCHYDTVNLRELSPAIPYIRLMQEAGCQESEIAYAGYGNIIFDNIVYAEEDVWKDQAQTDVSVADMETEETASGFVSPIASWSTTSLQQLLSCPLQFYYQRVLRLPNEDYKLPQADRWLPASEKGTLAHGVMEDYCNLVFLNKCASEISNVVDEKKFEDIFEENVQKMLLQCPYASKAAYEIERELVRMNCLAYLEKMHAEFSHPDNKWMVVACEKNFKDVDLSFEKDEERIALRFTGQMDRLDSYVDEDGLRHYRIMDYKSGKKDKNEKKVNYHQNVQHIVYKLALEQLEGDIKVDEVRFLHFFEEDAQNQEIICNETMIENFPEVVQGFVVDVLQEGAYDMESIFNGKEDDPCKYCTYKDMCKKHIGDEL